MLVARAHYEVITGRRPSIAQLRARVQQTSLADEFLGKFLATDHFSNREGAGACQVGPQPVPAGRVAQYFGYWYGSKLTTGSCQNIHQRRASALASNDARPFSLGTLQT